MLPADTIAAITTNLAGLNLAPHTAAQILAAVLAPLLRADPIEKSKPVHNVVDKMTTPKRSSARKARRRKAKRPRASAAVADGPRQRAIAALTANPTASVSAVAKIAGTSRSTVINARKIVAAQARKAARKAQPPARPAASSVLAKQDERRQRAQRFLREQLGRGPKQVTDVEAAAEKAHVDVETLARARADLGVVTSRGNAGGAHAVQWSLPEAAGGPTVTVGR